MWSTIFCFVIVILSNRNHCTCYITAHISDTRLLLHRSRQPKLRIYTVKRRFTLKMESGKVILSSSKHLKKFEGELFDAVMEYGYHVHIILIGHQCHDEKGYYDMFSTNLHPTIKCIYIPRSLIHDVRAINVVLRSNGHEGLEFFCPACPVGTPPDF